MGGACDLSGAEGSFSAATQETEKKSLKRSGEKERACRGRAAGAKWKRLIRGLPARNEPQGTTNESLKRSGSGPCRQRRAATAFPYSTNYFTC